MVYKLYDKIHALDGLDDKLHCLDDKLRGFIW